MYRLISLVLKLFQRTKQNQTADLIFTMRPKYKDIKTQSGWIGTHCHFKEEKLRCHCCLHHLNMKLPKLEVIRTLDM